MRNDEARVAGVLGTAARFMKRSIHGAMAAAPIATSGCAARPAENELVVRQKQALEQGPSFAAARLGYVTGGGQIVTGDMNGDGILDVVDEGWDSATGSPTIRVLVGDGTGNLLPGPSFPEGGQGLGLAVADVNGDGAEDVVALAYDSSVLGTAVWIQFGDGAGSYSPAMARTLEGYTIGGSGADSLRVVDLNADGELDIVVSLTGYSDTPRSDSPGVNEWSRLGVILGTGGGSFGPTVYYDSPIEGRREPFAIVDGDWNVDGRPDIAMADPGSIVAPGGGIAESDRITLFLGDGVGGFGEVRCIPVVSAEAPYRLLPGDFTGDGTLDLAALSQSGLVLFPGTGAATFGVPIRSVGAHFDQFTTARAMDQDRDGQLDVVSASGNTVSILRGDGTGHFMADAQYDVGGVINYGSFGDMTGDGYIDFVASVSKGSELSSTALLVADKHGGFVAARVELSNAYAGMMTTGDYNGDGLVDVAALTADDSGSTTITILPGVGGGAFGSAFTTSMGGWWNIYSAASGDFNGDGVADLAIGSTEGFPLVLETWLGSRTGLFSRASQMLLGDVSPRRVVVGDLNRDGRDDIVLAFSRFDSSGIMTNGFVKTYLGDGTGGLEVPTEYLAFADGQTESLDVTLADVNRDGNLDAVVSGSSGDPSQKGEPTGNIALLLGEGTGAFSTPMLLPSGGRVGGVISLDLNLDGYADIAASTDDGNVEGGPTSGMLRVWFGNAQAEFGNPIDTAVGPIRAMTLRPGDFDSDGLVDLLVGGFMEDNNPANTVGNPWLVLGTGAGGLAVVGPIGALSGGWFVVEDLDADGRFDVVTGSQGIVTVFNSAVGENTLSGSIVSVRPIDPTRGAAPARITFNLVAESGRTTVRSSTYGPLPPFGFMLGTPAEYFHIFTTAVFAGTIGMCIDYNPAGYLNPADVRFFHYNNGMWEDATTSNDSANGRICGQAWSLSPFALVEPIPADSPEEVVLTAMKDTALHRDEPNLNGGANVRLAVASDSRVLIGFDLSGVDVSRVKSAQLVLTVADTDRAGRGVLADAHRITESWVEGNGRNGSLNELGQGQGATWHCAWDQNIANRRPDCAGRWSGGTFVASSNEGALHSSSTRGDVSWDVTADVLAGAGAGWLIKLRQERNDARILYMSREGSERAAQPLFTPRLVLNYKR